MAYCGSLMEKEICRSGENCNQEEMRCKLKKSTKALIIIALAYIIYTRFIK